MREKVHTQNISTFLLDDTGREHSSYLYNQVGMSLKQIRAIKSLTKGKIVRSPIDPNASQRLAE